MSTATITERRVWVGCLACYNAGNLRGEWLTPADGVDWECPNPTHEETGCFDHEGFGSRGEMSPVEALEVDARMEAAEDAGIPGVVAESWYRDYGTDADISDAFIGVFDSLRDYVEDSVAEGMFGEHARKFYADHPGWLDIDAITNDLRCGGDVNEYEHNGAVYLFHP